MPKTSIKRKRTIKPKRVLKPKKLSKVNTKLAKVKAKRAPSVGPFVTYCLYHTHSNKTYTGVTNNFTRRLRQHNGSLAGGARYTKGIDKGEWKPIFHVCGFETKRSVLQFEIAMKKRKVPVRFRPGNPKQVSVTKTEKSYTRGPSGRVRQLEYILSLGKLNDEPHSPFVENGIRVECFIPFERYLELGSMTSAQFTLARDVTRGIGFDFK